AVGGAVMTESRLSETQTYNLKPALPNLKKDRTMSWRRAIIVLGLLGGLARLGPAQETVTKEEALKLLNQGRKHRQAGEYTKALPLLERVATAAPGLWGEDSTSHATVLNDLASLYQDTGQYAKAEPLFERSLKIREAKLGPEHPDVAGSLNNLALLYSD